jgi:UDP-glucose:(heptosyl)LPS alpha-1,3-glucosyltransferase
MARHKAVMRIAIIRKECSFRMGGAERYAANLARALCELGHEVLMLAARCDDDVHPALVHVPVKVDRRTSWTKNLSFNHNSRQALGGLRADAVLALSRSFPADAFRVSDPLHDYWMGIRYPGKIHRFLQTLNPRHRAILALEKGIFNPANTRFVITNSQLSKTLIPLSHPFPAERIHVIYNGVDLARFKPPDEPPAPAADGSARLLFVGQDFKRKGLAPLIRSLAEVKRLGHRFTLRVVGRDDARPYRKLAASLGMSDAVSFEGATTSIQQIYQSADLFVFPSLYDPFANVCLESLACGLPVLTTTTNGSSEVITAGEDGFIVDGAETGLAQALAGPIACFCTLSPARRAAMRARARATAERFTTEDNARRVAELLS